MSKTIPNEPLTSSTADQIKVVQLLTQRVRYLEKALAQTAQEVDELKQKLSLAGTRQR